MLLSLCLFVVINLYPTEMLRRKVPMRGAAVIIDINILGIGLCAIGILGRKGVVKTVYAGMIFPVIVSVAAMGAHNEYGTIVQFFSAKYFFGMITVFPGSGVGQDLPGLYIAVCIYANACKRHNEHCCEEPIGSLQPVPGKMANHFGIQPIEEILSNLLWIAQMRCDLSITRFLFLTEEENVILQLAQECSS